MNSSSHTVGASTVDGSQSNNDERGKNHSPNPTYAVQVHVDYISADEPIHQAFSPDTLLTVVKQWAREILVPHPPSDKTYYLNDDKTRHRFTAAEEQQTLTQLGYEHDAHLRLNEEQASGHAF